MSTFFTDNKGESKKEEEQKKLKTRKVINSQKLEIIR